MAATTAGLAHDFTLDELRAYDAGTLAPDRAAVVRAHLDAGCLACRGWLVNAGEIERLLRSGALPDTGTPGAGDGWRGRARAWSRRAVRPRRLAVLLYALPLKAALVALLLRREAGRGARAGAAVSIVALTVAVLRHVVTRPSWLAVPDSATGATGARRTDAE